MLILSQTYFNFRVKKMRLAALKKEKAKKDGEGSS